MTDEAPSTNLVHALEAASGPVRESLAEAEQELADLNARRRKLEALIARARAVIGQDAPVAADLPRQRLTLHEAMEQVLRETASGSMSAHDLAEAINQRQLYEKRDRSDVEPSQIHARANKYPQLFVKDGGYIRLQAGLNQV